jgi:translation initiation factor 6 (eIF-6)
MAMLPSCDTVSLVGGKKLVGLYAVASSKGMLASFDTVLWVGGEKSS